MRMDASPRAVLNARRQFFQQGLSGAPVAALLSEPILRSWQRCAQRGLNTSALPVLEPLTAPELRRIAERHEELRRLSRPEIESLYADAMQTGCVVVLTDAEGLILDAIGHADFAHRAAQVALRPGVLWDERSSGTNAIGTALVEGRPIAVHGGEHYYEPHGILSCSAAPIFDPYGNKVGALDLSGPAAVDHRHALGLVQLAVEQIEHRFFESDFAGRRILRLQSEPALLGTAREGVLVFEDNKLVAANRMGLKLIGTDWSAIGAAQVGEVLERLPASDGGVHTIRDASGRLLHGRFDASSAGAGIAVRSGEASRAGRDVFPRDVPPKAAKPEKRRRRHELEPIFSVTEQQAITRAIRLVEADVPVLIRGETGTGKELAAREIHRSSTRSVGPFIAVNCAAIPEALIESELFGYEEGAFTGARRQGRQGLLREADGGVLFLDEIGDMPLSLQSRLLRVLQEREVAPLGGRRPVKVDFALVCATHRDLRVLVEEGSFRQDLYFRIAHYTMELPALRNIGERANIVRELWRRVADDERLVLSPACEDCLSTYDWPGNFRQLAGTLRALAALADPWVPVGVEMLPTELREVIHPSERRLQPYASSREAGLRGVKREERLEDVTLDVMRRTLAACEGNVSLAARRLGINRSTLYRRLLNA